MPLSEVERRLGEAMLTNDALAGQAFKAEGAIQSSTGFDVLETSCNIRPLSARRNIATRTVLIAHYASTAQQLITKITPLLATVLARAS